MGMGCAMGIATGCEAIATGMCARREGATYPTSTAEQIRPQPVPTHAGSEAYGNERSGATQAPNADPDGGNGPLGHVGRTPVGEGWGG